MATTETTTVTVTFDGREDVQVPAGTPLVVAAAHAGVEIPVFCYGPESAPVGVCRMCLVEVEKGGRPCPSRRRPAPRRSPTAWWCARAHHPDGGGGPAPRCWSSCCLNHPLDCPVCGKGGECALQDLTFAYGPGKSRMTLPKRTYEKPLPISPSIVLDRERCILCHRCTRFSSDVAEDGELIARERVPERDRDVPGAPVRGRVQRQRTELCPVGALLPTPYRSGPARGTS